MRPVVHVDARWDDRRFMRELEDAIDDSLRVVGARVAATARTTSTPYDIREVLATARATPVYRGRRGRRTVAVIARHRLAAIFELGSYRKGRGKRQAGNRGVRAQRSLRNALRHHRGDLIDELRRRIPG